MTKGENKQTALFLIHPLYKVATSITFQNVWDYFSLFFYSTKIPGDIWGSFQSHFFGELHRHTQKRRTDGREKIWKGWRGFCRIDSFCDKMLSLLFDCLGPGQGSAEPDPMIGVARDGQRVHPVSLLLLRFNRRVHLHRLLLLESSDPGRRRRGRGWRRHRAVKTLARRDLGLMLSTVLGGHGESADWIEKHN